MLQPLLGISVIVSCFTYKRYACVWAAQPPHPPTPSQCCMSWAQVGIRCVRLEGSMSMEARDRMISAFSSDPGVTVFLMSLKAGGVALNLTAASHVMLMDPW